MLTYAFEKGKEPDVETMERIESVFGLHVREAILEILPEEKDLPNPDLLSGMDDGEVEYNRGNNDCRAKLLENLDEWIGK